MEQFQYDYFRICGVGAKISFYKILKDYRLLYLFAWRKISNKSKLSPFMKVIIKRLRKFYHIEIPYTAKIGKGFHMDHAYNITINSRAVIGNNVSMYKGSTIGADKRGVPTIGSNVLIGLNATIVGNVTIGDDVLVAPNTYVNFDVPSHSVVLGNPGVIHHKDNAIDGYMFNLNEFSEQTGA